MFDSARRERLGEFGVRRFVRLERNFPTWVNHKQCIQSRFRMENCRVKFRRATCLSVIRSVPALSTASAFRIYLFVHQENARFNRDGLPLCSCTKNNILRRSFWEDHTEVGGRLEDGENVRNDMHLIEALHLNRNVEKCERK